MTVLFIAVLLGGLLGGVLMDAYDEAKEAGVVRTNY